jgi:hypothetical protein
MQILLLSKIFPTIQNTVYTLVNGAFFCDSDYKASNEGGETRMMSSGSDVEGICSGQFKVLSQHLPGGTEKTTKTSVRIAGIRADICTRDLQLRSKNVNHSTTYPKHYH